MFGSINITESEGVPLDVFDIDVCGLNYDVIQSSVPDFLNLLLSKNPVE